jgi:uncharacterized damage-inducible protein DinB
VNARSRFDSNNLATRRNFLSGTAAAIAGGFAGSSLVMKNAAAADVTGPNVLGPRPGYSPQIGTFVSQLTWMREENGVLNYTKGLTQADLDYLFDANANTIGALMLHLAATETYGMNTFDGMKWGSWSVEVKKNWDAAMDLGDVGRKTIKGHDREYYVGILGEVREKTLAEFRKKDDAWFLAANKDPDWGGPVNNLAKWFHVCEHESHHCGQIAMQRKRLPGAKPTAG